MIRKMKKPIAILVILLLSMTALVGCGVADVAYMALLMERSNIESFRFQGEFTLEVPDPNAPSSFRRSPLTGLSTWRSDEMMTISMGISGTGIQTGEGSPYFDFTITYGINNRRMPHSIQILMADDKLYIPVRDFINFMSVYYQYIEQYSATMASNLRTALAQELAGHDYVIINGVTDAPAELPAMMSGGFMMGTALGVDQSNEITQLIMDALPRMFSGLSSGMTSVGPNGVTLEITPERTMAFAEHLIEFLQSNRRAIFREMLNLMGEIEETFRDGDMTKELIRITRFEMEDAEQDFYDAIDYMAEVFAEIRDFDRDLFLLTLRGSRFKHTISRSGNTYSETIEAVLRYQGETQFSLQGQSTMTRTSVDKRTVSAENPIDMAGIDVAMNNAYNSANPATALEITWWYDDHLWWGNPDDVTTFRSGTLRRAEGRSWVSIETILEGGTLYLPVRQVAEWFDEEVGWDNTARKAYIARDGERIQMDGRIEYRTMFVRAREFEKLGYTVEHEGSYGRHTVIITKN